MIVLKILKINNVTACQSSIRLTGTVIRGSPDMGLWLGLSPFSVEFLCVGLLLLLQFPLTVQNKLPHQAECRS